MVLPIILRLVNQRANPRKIPRVRSFDWPELGLAFIALGIVVLDLEYNSIVLLVAIIWIQ